MPEPTNHSVERFLVASCEGCSPVEYSSLEARSSRTAESSRDPFSVLAIIVLAALSILAWIQIGMAQTPS
ncbi:MAG TPA: hypothetical protein VNN21_03165 [Dehalococcoidia bacterium]|nr:hypothetical protein [Dehalococcoidia bacterium]